jgi:hypothetical protein
MGLVGLQPERQWLQTRKMKLRFEFSFLQRQSLRKWFDSMDADGSGDISINELTDALLSTGACQRCLPSLSPLRLLSSVRLLDPAPVLCTCCES